MHKHEFFIKKNSRVFKCDVFKLMAEGGWGNNQIDRFSLNSIEPSSYYIHFCAYVNKLYGIHPSIHTTKDEYLMNLFF